MKTVPAFVTVIIVFLNDGIGVKSILRVAYCTGIRYNVTNIGNTGKIHNDTLTLIEIKRIIE